MTTDPAAGAGFQSTCSRRARLARSTPKQAPSALVERLDDRAISSDLGTHGFPVR
jgi:hypothetical protein